MSGKLTRASSTSIMALIAAFGFADPATAETTEPEGEIVVTATRAEATSIQQVPLAITAIDPDRLQKKGIETLADLSRSVPGLSMQEEGGGQNKIVIRGITTGGGTVITDTAEQALVSVYLDDVPISIQGFTPDLKVFDLERVEFLRGPQGTLFGAGAMAGTVRYITRKPVLNRTEGSAEASLATTAHGAESYSVRGMINLPLITDTLALRVTGYHGQDGGYIDNIGNGQTDINKLKTTQIRSVLRFDNSAGLTVDLNYLYGDVKTGGANRVYSGLQKYQSKSDLPESLTDRFHIANLSGELDLKGLKLYSSTSYIDRKVRQDTSGEFVMEYFFGLGGSAPAYAQNKIADFTQELRLATDGSGPLSVQLGAFYEHQTRRYLQNNLSTGFDAALDIDSLEFGGFFPDSVFSSDTYTRTKQFALFGEAKYTLGPVDVTAGGRYFDWSQYYTLYTGGVAGALGPGQPLTLVGRSKAKGFNPRFAATYHVNDDVMFYAEAARGFRYGGVNQAVPTQFCAGALAADGLTKAPEDYGPDKLWTYTVGEKASLFGRRATFNVAGFLTEWSDVQTRHLLEQCGYYFTQNAGRIQSKGVEVESRIRATDALTLNFTGSLTDAKAREAMPDISAVRGDRVPYFPKYIASAGMEYEVPLGNDKLLFQSDYTYRSSTGTQFSPTDPNYRTIKASGVLNASITWTHGPLQVSLYGRNLTDNYIVTGVAVNNYVGVQPGDSVFIGRPRTIGVRLRSAF